MEHATLWHFAAHLRIAHHIPGRVRLKLDGGVAGLGAGIDEVKRFMAAVSRIPGIHKMDMNLLARSCVVEYDHGIISPQAWQDLVAGARSDAAQALVGALTEVCPG